MVDIDGNNITGMLLCWPSQNKSFDDDCATLDDNTSSSSTTTTTTATAVTSRSFSSLEFFAMVSKLVILIVIILTTIVGNILVLFAVFINTHLRTTTNYFIVNLAVADLLLGTTVLPFSASLEILKRWDFGDLFCDIWAAVDVLCCTASIISLCVISVDRYIGVTRPLAYSTIMTESRAVVLIFAVWVVSIAIGVGPLFGWKEKHQDPKKCTVTTQLGYVLFSVSGSFYIPTTVILLVYYRIYREAVKQTKFLESGVKKTKAEPNGCQEVTLRVHTGGLSSGFRSQSIDSFAYNNSPERHLHTRGHHHLATGHQGKLAKFKRQKKAAKTLGIVVGVFILCWFPFFFLLPLGALCHECYIPEDVFQVFFWLGYCNSCLNPIIYASSSREFKRAFARILRGEFRRKSRILSKEATMNKTCVITLGSKTTTNRLCMSPPSSEALMLTGNQIGEHRHYDAVDKISVTSNNHSSSSSNNINLLSATLNGAHCPLNVSMDATAIAVNNNDVG